MNNNFLHNDLQMFQIRNSFKLYLFLKSEVLICTLYLIFVDILIIILNIKVIRVILKPIVLTKKTKTIRYRYNIHSYNLKVTLLTSNMTPYFLNCNKKTLNGTFKNYLYLKSLLGDLCIHLF